MDSHDKPHIRYLGTGARSDPLKYASWTETTWDTKTITEATYNTGNSDFDSGFGFNIWFRRWLFLLNLFCKLEELKKWCAAKLL